MKKRAPSLLLALLALAGLLTAGGCSLGRSPRPDFYMLSPRWKMWSSPAKKKSPATRRHRTRVHSGHLDRPQLFLRDGNDVKVELAEFNHWSEPFGEGVTRVLCDAVSASLTPRKGLASPMRSQQPFQWRIAVDIARFDGAPNGSVMLDAGWSLVNESGEELKSGRFVQHAPAGPDIPSMVQAQSALLAQFGAVLGQMIP
ncbi:MAG: membrane integrity-associated transporter subunit PqiC [Bilophila wadsworthia]